MAGGDWIRMRGLLLNHPTVAAISRRLAADPDFQAWALPGYPSGYPRFMSDGALRKVTVAALLSCWSASRVHGEFVSNDLVMRHAIISDLDEMGGVPGLGKAMQGEGWATNENGVTLPRFITYNTPMTGAERQKRYRERVTKPLHKSDDGSVTNPSQRREEKRRDNNTPISPLFFDRFWSSWPSHPRKVAREKCRTLWRKRKLDDRAEQIIGALDAAKISPDWTKDEGNFIPQPYTWLNQSRWEAPAVQTACSTAMFREDY